jgi:DNA-binding response OmpR family regulator
MVILVVEDDFLIGWTLKLVLAVAGHHALGPAASAEEALQLARKDQPELAFVDINIAGDRDGIEVARALTRELGTSCIFLTAQADRARAARDTALGLIDKPYDPYEVVRAVDVVHSIRSGATLPAIPRRLELFHRPPPTMVR